MDIPPATSIQGQTVTLDSEAVDDFQSRLRGALLRPEDESYGATRQVWNGMIDRRPALIARCMGVADVMASVNFAREQGLLIAVKGGGHSVAGHAVCDGGLMIDLAPMKSVQVDPTAKTARVEAGARWGDIYHETQAFGLVAPGGIVSTTGVAGVTLGGGWGWLSRSYGLAIDNLRSVDIVTADGALRHASEEENEDLFWGIRGGGGNFGVVTSFEFQLREVGPEVLTAQIFLPIEQAREALRFYRDFTAGAPDEVACYALVLHVPPAAPFPEPFHGKTALALVACYSGAVEDGAAALAPLQDVGDPILEVVQPIPFTAFHQSFDASVPEGERYYWKAHFLDALPDVAIDTLVDHTDSLPGPFTIVALEQMGGAIGRVDPAATAFRHREAMCSLGIWSGWSDPDADDEIIAWTQALHEAMAPYATGGVYVNLLDRDDGDKVEAAYGANYDRLARLKAKYDPENLFRMNQNIAPEVA